MTKFLKKTVAGLTIASTLGLMATPADAQYRYRYRHRDHTSAVIGAGLIGLGIGAAISSSNRGRYYDDGYYYNRGSYDRGYYGYHRCVTRWEYDPYYDQYVRVRYC
jgi:hypothetical protein